MVLSTGSVMDLAMKLTKCKVWKQYPMKEQQHETGEDAARLFSNAWLSDKLRPRWVVPDTASSLNSTVSRMFSMRTKSDLQEPQEMLPGLMVKLSG